MPRIMPGLNLRHRGDRDASPFRHERRLHSRRHRHRPHGTAAKTDQDIEEAEEEEKATSEEECNKPAAKSEEDTNKSAAESKEESKQTKDGDLTQLAEFFGRDVYEEEQEEENAHIMASIGIEPTDYEGKVKALYLKPVVIRAATQAKGELGLDQRGIQCSPSYKELFKKFEYSHSLGFEYSNKESIKNWLKTCNFH